MVDDMAVKPTSRPAVKIGGVAVEGWSVLAPLAGITDLPFRLMCRRLGAALVYTEMISCEGLVREQKRTAGLTSTDPSERPVAFQIFGSNPDSMARAAETCSRIGADIVDINMGCPVRKVVKSRSGSALLKDLARAAELMKAVVSASGVPVTIKIRTGWDSSDFVATEFALAAEDAGVAAVAVHGRHARQGFSGLADWSAIRRVKEAVGIPVIGNGDILNAHDAARMLDETGCDLVMIGRGALGNPWIFREVETYLKTGAETAPPTLVERGQTLIGHLRSMAEFYGVTLGVKLMRKHGAWYSKGYRGSADFRKLINHAETLSEFEDAVSRFFFEDKPERQ